MASQFLQDFISDVKRSLVEGSTKEAREKYKRDLIDKLPNGIARSLTNEQQEELAQLAWDCMVGQVDEIINR